MSPARIIWLLKHRRAGDLAQMRHLAGLLQASSGSGSGPGWEVVEKQLAFRLPQLVRFSMAAGILLDRENSDPLTPPWPDAIIAVEAPASWVATSLKARSGNRIKLIALGRPAGATEPFDLVLTTAQYALPTDPNIVRLPVPLAAPAPPAEGECQDLLRQMAGKARPWTAILIGGSVPPDRLDRAAIAGLAQAARDIVASGGGSLIVLTSPRTGKDREADAGELLQGAALLQSWGNMTPPNLYGATLAEADRFLVTSDSVSMVVEAVNTGKPVSLFMLPQIVPPGMRLISALDRRAGLRIETPRHVWKALAPLFASGLVKSPARRQLLFQELIGRGVLAVYPEFSRTSGATLIREAESLALSAIGALLA